jgi:hypothetical protein
MQRDLPETAAAAGESADGGEQPQPEPFGYLTFGREL